ncbi:MAG: methyltransferase domain-containing protein [Pseudomonadota bacterium]
MTEASVPEGQGAGGAVPPPPDWCAARYGRNARFVADLAASLVDDLAAATGGLSGVEVLDLGCGDGAMTARLIERGARVTGIDASADMVAAARAAGIEASVMDAQALSFAGAFDAVFSNAAIHWMGDQQAVIDGVARALRPGGVFVAEQGGQGNVAAIRTALIVALAEQGIQTTLDEIWAFPSPDDQRARLEHAGFAVEAIALTPRPTPLDCGMGAWLETLAAPVLARLPAAARAPAMARAETLLAPALRDGQGRWWGDYVRLRYCARLP